MTVRRFQDDVSLRELVIDPEIPGQIGWEALIAMARVAKRVPAHGTVVETGSLFGRSSFVWAMNVDPTVQVFCVDPWVREQWIIDIVEKVQNPVMPFSIEAFRYYTQDCTNITTMQGYSPDVAKGWNRAIDLYFDDSDHGEPGLSRNWSFWIPWVKPGGIVCGDEYAPEYPDVLRKIGELEKAWGTTAEHVGLFWWMRKPE